MFSSTSQYVEKSCINQRFLNGSPRGWAVFAHAFADDTVRDSLTVVVIICSSADVSSWFRIFCLSRGKALGDLPSCRAWQAASASRASFCSHGETAGDCFTCNISAARKKIYSIGKSYDRIGEKHRGWEAPMTLTQMRYFYAKEKAIFEVMTP